MCIDLQILHQPDEINNHTIPLFSGKCRKMMNMALNILIVDDEAKLRSLLARLLKLEGFSIYESGDLKSARKAINSHTPDVILCDVKLPDGNGVDFITEIKQKYPAIEIILLTAYGNIPDGVQAIKNGAFDYITKGDDNNKIIPMLYRACEKAVFAKKEIGIEKQLGEKHSISFDTIIGKSKIIKATIEDGKKVAATDTTVLLTGETGTGKEVFAQAIHNSSNRSKQNFIAINCSAFSNELLENELFGHKAGAYTGATKDAKGIFEEANNGTVFLDEIGEMPLNLQAKLLRVLETGEFLKVGDNKTTKINVRIIAATNRNLQEEIENGNFREDLYYRIAVFLITIPPLRDRLMDIDDLAIYFQKIFSAKSGKNISRISPEYIAAMKLHSWKGNIRELRNVIERSVILCDGVLDVEHLPVELQNEQTVTKSGKPLSSFELAKAEKLHIQKVMNYTNGNKTRTAELLNIALTTLYRKLEEYQIK